MAKTRIVVLMLTLFIPATEMFGQDGILSNEPIQIDQATRKEIMAESQALQDEKHRRQRMEKWIKAWRNLLTMGLKHEGCEAAYVSDSGDAWSRLDQEQRSACNQWIIQDLVLLDDINDIIEQRCKQLSDQIEELFLKLEAVGALSDTREASKRMAQIDFECMRVDFGHIVLESVVKMECDKFLEVSSEIYATCRKRVQHWFNGQ